MKIIIGCDNAAVELKSKIIRFLEAHGMRVDDIGCSGEEDTTHYPLIAAKLCEKIIAEGYTSRGILLCGTGIGMCIMANKYRGIRAAVCHDGYSAERSILSNDSNVLCLGARVVGSALAEKIVAEWMKLTFADDGPSAAKVNDILRLEQANLK